VNLSVQEIFTCRDSRTRPPSYSRISRIPEVRGSAGSRFRVIARSRLRGFESSGFQTTVRSRLRDFVSFRFQIFAISLLLKTYITNFINLDVSRVTGFPEFPNILLPLKSPRLKCSLRVPILHLRNCGSRTLYTKLFLRLPQSPRAHQEPPKHQDRPGAVKLQE
jgi:hypothetical protein